MESLIHDKDLYMIFDTGDPCVTDRSEDLLDEYMEDFTWGFYLCYPWVGLNGFSMDTI